MKSFDVLVVGSGIAGLTASLQLAGFCSVALLTKYRLANASTYHAQGGIAAVLSDDDSLDAHIEDTLIAGAGLCDPIATQAILSRGAQAIGWLLGQGVALSQADKIGSLHLTREGGHSKRRIVHAADATGKTVHDALTARASSHPNIAIFEDSMVIDIIVATSTTDGQRHACGLFVLNRLSGDIHRFAGGQVILATGGASGIYRHTTHPDAPIGEGIAMAWRAGCSVANLEFTQFHPTSLFCPDQTPFLISEALRGEGAVLRRVAVDGGCDERFMPSYDRRAELAPRDIVARAIDHEIKIGSHDYVWLDISHQPADFLRSHFPTIHDHCLSLGIDITTMPIPVVPAAHYSCGGIVTDLSGQTTIANLYAIGETAYTGLHGANRLASNSLLECLVSGFLATEAIADSKMSAPSDLPQWTDERIFEIDQAILSDAKNRLKQMMSRHVGIVRSKHSLRTAMETLKTLVTEHPALTMPARQLERIELRNRLLVAELTIHSAMARQESRGLHHNVDYPGQLPEAMPTILTPTHG